MDHMPTDLVGASPGDEGDASGWGDAWQDPHALRAALEGDVTRCQWGFQRRAALARIADLHDERGEPGDAEVTRWESVRLAYRCHLERVAPVHAQGRRVRGRAVSRLDGLPHIGLHAGRPGQRPQAVAFCHECGRVVLEHRRRHASVYRLPFWPSSGSLFSLFALTSSPSVV